MLFAIMRTTTVSTYPWPTFWLRARRGSRGHFAWDLMRGFGEPPYADDLLPSTRKGLVLFQTYEAAAQTKELLRRPGWDAPTWEPVFGNDVQVIGWVEYCGDATGHPHEDCAASPALSRACAAQRREAIEGWTHPPSAWTASARSAAWAAAAAAR